MRKIKHAGLVVAMLLLAGCIPSLHPLYEEKDVVADDTIVGEWRQANDEHAWVFAKDGTNTYRLSRKDAEGESVYVARLLKLGDRTYLDIEPDRRLLEKTGGLYRRLLQPTHLFFHVRQVQPALEVAPLQPDWFEKYLEAKPTNIQVAVTGPDRFDRLITSGTAELQEFVKKHPEAFTSYSHMEKVQAKQP